MSDKQTYEALKLRVKQLELELEERRITAQRLQHRIDNKIDTVAYGRDIGNEIEFQKALEASEKRFRHLIENVSEISIQGYDENRIVTFWNRASEKIYGYTAQEALGRKLEDLIIPPVMKQNVITRHDRWLNHDEAIPAGELTLIDNEGNDVHVFSSHIMYETGNRKEMFCIDIDLSPIIKAEKEKMDLQEQLIHSQKMEAVGTLTSGIAHDFNNILQVIGGFTDYLTLTKNGNEHLTNGLREIRKATDRAMDLIHRLMSFTRKQPTTQKRANINNEIKRFKTLMEKIIPKMISIETDLPDDIMDVSVDPVRIVQIILNLGTNAADAMSDSGSGTISIRTANVFFEKEPAMESGADPLSGYFVELSVTDTGHGIDPETMEKIYSPFFTTKQIGKGTGLGLASVHDIVKTHGGLIRCHSRPGRGTTFNIYLPAISPLKEQKKSLRRTQVVHGTETILMVDDESSIIDFTGKALKLFGYTFWAASSGEEALATFSEKGDEIDLVILDINMPGMGGYKCLKKLKAIDPSLKVVISSGYSENPVIKSCMENGAMEFIKKPFKIPQMMSSLRKILDGKE